MRIMLDTNVLISAILFPGDKINNMMNYIFLRHQLVLSLGFFRAVAKVCEKSDIYKSYEHTRDYVSEIHCADKRISDTEVIIVA